MPYADPERRRDDRTSNSAGPPATSGGRRARVAGAGYAEGRAALRPAASEDHGWLGWIGDQASSAGDWISRQADGAGDWVTDQAQGAAEWASETAEGIGDAASNAATQVRSAWDTAAHTDVDLDRQGISVSMRMADLRKMLPPEAAQRVRFDERRLDDRVRARYEYGSNHVTLSAPSVSLAGLSIQDFQTGAARATDVVIVLSNPGGRIPFVEEGWQQSGDLRMSVQIGGATATDVRQGAPGAGIAADALEIEGLSVHGGAPTSRVLGRGGGVIDGGFVVERAVVRGLRGSGFTAGDVAVTGGSASWRDDTDQVTADARSLQVGDLTTGAGTLSSGALSDVQANVNGQAGTASASRLTLTGYDNAGEGVGAADLGNLQASWDGARGTSATSAESMALKDLAFGQTHVGGVQGQGVSVRTATGEGGVAVDAGADRLGITGLSVGDDVRLREGALSGVDFSTDPAAARLSASARGLEGEGLWTSTFGAERVSGTDVGVGVDHRAQTTTVSASAAGFTDLSALDGRAATAGLEGFTYARDSRAGTSVTGADALRLDGIASSRGTADSARVDGLSLTQHDAGEQLGVSADQLRAAGLRSDLGSADALTAAGLHLSTGLQDGARTSESSVARFGVTGLSTQHGGADALTADTFRGSVREQDGVRTAVATLGQLDAEGVRSQHGGAASLSASGLDLASGPDGARAGLTRLTAEQIAAGDLSAQHLAASDLSAARAGDSTSLRVGSADARTLRYGDVAQASRLGLEGGWLDQGPNGVNAGVRQAGLADALVSSDGSRLRVGGADLSGLEVARNGAGTTVAADQASLGVIQGTWARQAGSEAGVDVPLVDLSRHELEARLALDSGRVGVGGGTGNLVRDVGGLVRDADVRMSAPLNPADLGPVAIQDGTSVDARIAVRDGSLVPGQTGASLTRPLDGPLWTTVNGVELDAARGWERQRRHGPRGGLRQRRVAKPGQGTLRADVGGFFDQNVTRDAMQALGRDSRTVPLSVGELSALAATRMEQQAPTGEVTLATERAGDNELHLRSQAEGAVASFVRLLVSSMRVQVGGTSVSTGRTAVSGARVEAAGTPSAPDQLTGTIQSLELDRLRTSTPAGQ